MEKIVKQQKEKVKPDKDRLGVTWNCNYDYAVKLEDGTYFSPVTKKKFKEINIDTSKHIPDNDGNRY